MLTGYSQFLSDEYIQVCTASEDNGGSRIFYTYDNGFIRISSDLLSAEQVQTPVPVNFPDPEPNWYYQGYPEQIEAGTADGSLVNYVPVSFFARKTGNVKIAFNEIEIYDGYLNSKKEYVKELQIDGRYTEGDFVFAILLNKYAGAARYTKLLDKSYWKLLIESSNVEPDEVVKETVSITSGITSTESKTFSNTVGATIGFKAGVTGAEINASLSTSLTNSFTSSVTVSSQITVSSEVNFPAQDREQRIAVYQFIADYNIIPGGPLKGWRDYLNGTSTDEAKFFSNQFICNVDQPPKFSYPSRYFATTHVLEPQ